MVAECHCVPGSKGKTLVPPCGCGRCRGSAHLSNFGNAHWRDVYFREKKDTLEGMVREYQDAKEYTEQAALLGHDAGTIDCDEAYQLSMDAVLARRDSTGFVTGTLISGASPEDPTDPLPVSVSFKVGHAEAEASSVDDDEGDEDFYTSGIAEPC